MKTETVTLGGNEYTIAELPLRKNAEWRAKLDETLQKFGDLLGMADEINLSDTGNVLSILRDASKMIVHSPDLAIDLFFAYAVELEADRSAIMDSAYESELMEAFKSVLKLAYPFGGLGRLFSTLTSNGSAEKPIEPTSMNSSLPHIQI